MLRAPRTVPRRDRRPEPEIRMHAHDARAERALILDAAERAARYRETLPTRRVGPDPAAVASLGRLHVPLPEAPGDPAQALAELDAFGSAAAMGTGSPRFFGFVIGGALPATVAANVLAAAWDEPCGLWNINPAVCEIEAVARGWLLGVLGLPAETGIGFTTGATVANFTALAAARHAVLKRAGWNVEADGLFGAPPIHVVIGAEAHPTLRKSLGLLGLGRSRVTIVPVDGQGRFRAEAMPKLEGPAIVCLQAGNINTGAMDPFDEAIARAHAAGAWVHVDGAFGLWALASPALRDGVRGLERADSWATDAHKWLNVTYDSGLAFSRDPHALQAAMAITAEYLPTDSSHRNPSDFVPELSRRARGVEVWAALRTLGRSGVADLVDRCCAHARRFADGLRAAGFEVLNDVTLNQVLVSFGTPEQTQRTIEAIQKDGTCWCGGTVWQGRTAMRISVSGYSTTTADVDRSLEAIVRCARAFGVGA